MSLRIGWAWLLTLCFSTPLYVVLVYFWGMPKDIIELIKYSGIVGFFASVIGIVLLLCLKIQARKP